MPTPFYHIRMAEDLLGRSDLSPQVRELLENERPAFLLGNTAPDVQTVSRQDRRTTHFFDVPVRPNDLPAWEGMLHKHPELLHSQRLSPSQRAFVAGYLCHLQADWLWVLQIYLPVFGPFSGWQSFRRRLYLHNVLRSYLDQSIRADLNGETGRTLGYATPRRWLPFVDDGYLLQWRNVLIEQLQPGAIVRTVEVFAARQGIPAEAYYQLMHSERRLDREIFERLPRASLESYRRRLLDENIRLLHRYFGD